MSLSLRQKVKKSLIFLCFIILGLLFSFHFTQTTRAEGPGGLMEGAETEAIGVESYSLGQLIFSPVANFIIALITVAFQVFLIAAQIGLDIAVGLLIWVTHPDFISLSYTNPAGNPLLATGWTLIRNLANMGFVISFAFIGLATALRIKEYQAQKLLPSLILMALLVNFTPVILGVIVDASNILMNFLLGEVVNFQFIADMWATQWSVFSEQLKALTGAVINYEPLAATITLIIFAGTTSFIIGLYIFLFLFRYVAIWILVILSPLAFFCYVLPVTRKIWFQWWNQFFQWCFIGVTMAFFLYLGNHLLAALTQEKILSEAPSKVGGLVETFLPYTVVIALLIYGLLMGLSSSAIGASYVIKAAKWTGRAVMGATRAAGTAMVERGKVRARERVPREWREKAEEWARASVPGTAEPGIKGALKRAAWGPIYALRRKVTAPLTTKTERDEIKKAAEKVKDAPIGDILTKIRAELGKPLEGNRAQIIGHFSEILRRPREKGIDEAIKKGLSGAEIKKIFEKAIATETGAHKDMVKILPELAPLVNPAIPPAEAREGVIAKIEPKLVRQMSKDSLKLQKNLDEIIKHFGFAHMREIEDLEVSGEIIRTMNKRYEAIRNRAKKKGLSDRDARRLAFRRLSRFNRDLLKWRLTSNQAQKSPHYKHEILYNPRTGNVYSSRELKRIFAATAPTPPTKPSFPSPP